MKLFKELFVEPSESKTKVFNLRKNLIAQSQKLIDDSLKNKIKIDKDEIFKISLSSFLKPEKNRDVKDIALISLYLSQMKKFMKLFSDNFNSVEDPFHFEHLKRISNTIMYNKFEKNRIVVKFGEEGKKFFLILKGEVQVILPTKKSVSMRQREYKRYLFLLYIYKEYEMLKLVIKDNKLNQKSDMFDPSQYFFSDENMNNIININNKDKLKNRFEDSKKVTFNYNYKGLKSGFDKIEKRKTITSKNLGNDFNGYKTKFKDFEKEKTLRKLMKYYLFPEELAFYEKTKNINLKEVDNGIHVTPIEYIFRISDFINIKVDTPLKENNTDDDFFMNDDLISNYFIYEYKKLTELQTGDCFGDLALTGNNIKRTATIVSIEECHFACLTRELYSAFIEKGNERIRNNKINYLLSIKILKPFPKFILEKKLFNHFAFKTFIKDKFLLKTNEINNDIIFLKDGVFEVSFNGNLEDLNNLIIFFYREFNNLANKKEKEKLEKNIINNLRLIEAQKYKIEGLFQRDIKKEFSYVLFLVNAPSIFGFRETEKKKTKFVINQKKRIKEKTYVYYSNFSVKCHISKGEYIYIDKNIFYKHIYGTDSLVQEETKNYILDYLKKIMKRLLNIRYSKLWNLFLSNGFDKILNSNINFEKTQYGEDIYDAVNKLLAGIKGGQMYTNELSRNINNYFENTEKINKSQKQLIKIVNQKCENDKLKEIIQQKQNREGKTDNNIKYNSYKVNINSIFFKNPISINSYSVNKNETEKSNKIKMRKRIIREKFLQNKESINKSINDMNCKYLNTKNSKKYRSISANILTNTNTSDKDLKKNNLLNNFTKKGFIFLKQAKNFSNMRKQNSLLSSTDSYVKKKIKIYNFQTPKMDNLSLVENNKYNEVTMLGGNKFKNFIKKLNLSRNSPNSSRNICYNSHFNYLKKSQEKYEKERVNYVIKSTRILFTKTKNLDKIVRRKRLHSAL